MIATSILLAEDEESDAMIFRMALERAGITNPLIILSDGQEAVDYLSGLGAYADRIKHPLPGLLVLDLKMPRMSGFDVLTWLAQRPEFASLPAVVLSSSPAEMDIMKAKSAGAREYFVKPHNLKDLIGILQTLQARWLGSTAS